MPAGRLDSPAQPVAPSERVRRLAALARAVRRGEYHPDAARIAGALLRALPWLQADERHR